MHDRRQFIGRVAAGAMLGAMPLGGLAAALAAPAPRGDAEPDDTWDLSWVKRVTGKYRAIFDVPEIDSGYGVWRASLWTQQYGEVLKVPASEMSAVLVLRHKGIALAMKQSFWDAYGVSKQETVLHPITQQGTDRNPALLSSSRGEVPADFDAVALDKFIARGGIALACNLALDDMIALVTKKDNAAPEVARKTAIDGFVPGVILQPSGVFAALHAQDAGCKYLRAS